MIKLKISFGEAGNYPADYINFAADDDSNGPLFFLRLSGRQQKGYHVKSQDVAEALLNYAPLNMDFSGGADLVYQRSILLI